MTPVAAVITVSTRYIISSDESGTAPAAMKALECCTRPCRSLYGLAKSDERVKKLCAALKPVVRLGEAVEVVPGFGELVDEDAGVFDDGEDERTVVLALFGTKEDFGAP